MALLVFAVLVVLPLFNVKPDVLVVPLLVALLAADWLFELKFTLPKPAPLLSPLLPHAVNAKTIAVAITESFKFTIILFPLIN